MKIKFYVIILIIAAFTALSCKKKINPALNKPLMTAIQAGDFAQVKKLVGDGADVNANTGGFLPLVEAINKKYTDIARFLVDEEVNVNLQDKDGDTAIIVAALRGNMEILPLLKKQGADFNIRNKQGKTALIYGIFNGSLPVVEYLLNNGADVIQQDNTGEDAVSMAVRKKDENSLKLLLVNGGAVTLKHLKLAFELLCVPNNTGYFPFYKSLYPKVTRLLENEYLIIKNVDYTKISHLVKTILSEDGARKAEHYDNGIIKIFNVKDNSFIKAFGNLQFVKEIRYVSQDKMYIKKENNFKIENYPYYDDYIVKKKPASSILGTSLYGVGTMEFTFLMINKNHLNKLKIEWAEHAMISSTGSFYIIIRSSIISGTTEFKIYDFKTDKLYYSWSLAHIITLYNLSPSSSFIKSIFFRQDRYYTLCINCYPNGQSIAGGVFVFDILKKKLILVKIYNGYISDINFNKGMKSLLINFTHISTNRNEILKLNIP